MKYILIICIFHASLVNVSYSDDIIKQKKIDDLFFLE
jgi:hypothetical protein